MLTLVPIEPGAAAQGGPETTIIRMTVGVAVNARGGWALVGWRGAGFGELRQQVELLLDDPQGLMRIATVDVAVPSQSAVAQMVGSEHG